MSQELSAKDAGDAMRAALTGAGMIFGAKGAEAGKLTSFNTGSLDNVAAPAHT